MNRQQFLIALAAVAVAWLVPMSQRPPTVFIEWKTRGGATGHRQL